MIEKILGTKQFTGYHMLGVMFLFFGTQLLVMPLRILYTVDENAEPLLVLTTWFDPEKGSLQR
ncbi:MAG: hypothetical protein JJ992_28360 [Planctomycetes bacterium]|nr:hypothetical protein [Planctomycetota bacterium]